MGCVCIFGLFHKTSPINAVYFPRLPSLMTGHKLQQLCTLFAAMFTPQHNWARNNWQRRIIHLFFLSSACMPIVLKTKYHITPALNERGWQGGGEIIAPRCHTMKKTVSLAWFLFAVTCKESNFHFKTVIWIDVRKEKGLHTATWSTIAYKAMIQQVRL